MADDGAQLPRWTSKFTLSAQKPSLAPLLLDENERGGPAGGAGGGLVRPALRSRMGGSKGSEAVALQSSTSQCACQCSAVALSLCTCRARGTVRAPSGCGKPTRRRSGLRLCGRTRPTPRPSRFQLSPKSAFRAGTPLGGARRVPLGVAGAVNVAAASSSLATVSGAATSVCCLLSQPLTVQTAQRRNPRVHTGQNQQPL